ncbi:uncharacterized protein RAG0_07243 [Rhynchosporium agropyri]|uniref:Uncharacterized protein n=1 Tax=Rhynchosporium agropyri TaxID=914238 RepID=A0A1E1KKJ4_9HELO|nr:uncharacterized protein RAG0_07243 [Rhynchosporium agropyri]
MQPTTTRLLARSFHRISHRIPNPVRATTSASARALSTSSPSPKWEGRKPEENPVREGDSNNVQHDAVKAGKEERAKGKESASRGASQSGEGSVERAESEFPEAPDTIGMQDERGGKA